MAYRVLLEGRSPAPLTEIDKREIEHELADIDCHLKPGRKSAEGSWQRMMSWYAKGGRRRQQVERVLAFLSDEAKEEMAANFPHWWSAQVLVQSRYPELAGEMAMTRLSEAFERTGRSSWTVMGRKVIIRSWPWQTSVCWVRVPMDGPII